MIMTIVTNPWFIIACCGLLGVLCAFIESKRKPLDVRLGRTQEPKGTPPDIIKAANTCVGIEQAPSELQKAPEVKVVRPRRRRNKRRKSHNPNG